MINIYPNGISSSELFGVILIPTVFSIGSAEAFGILDIPRFAEISSGEAFGSPTIGIWWLHWRAFDNFNLFVRQQKVFSTTDERYQYAESLMMDMMMKGEYRFEWKFTPIKFGRPILPKTKVWDHRAIYIRETLR